jgi:preprotein translocase subunit YajC
MTAIALLQSAANAQIINTVIMFGGVFLVFYFLVIAPSNKQRKKTEEMLSLLKKGDRVVTSGGIYGTVQGVEGDVVHVKIAENVKVRIARSAVTGVITGDAAE